MGHDSVIMGNIALPTELLRLPLSPLEHASATLPDGYGRAMAPLRFLINSSEFIRSEVKQFAKLDLGLLVSYLEVASDGKAKESSNITRIEEIRRDITRKSFPVLTPYEVFAISEMVADVACLQAFISPGKYQAELQLARRSLVNLDDHTSEIVRAVIETYDSRRTIFTLANKEPKLLVQYLDLVPSKHTVMHGIGLNSELSLVIARIEELGYQAPLHREVERIRGVLDKQRDLEAAWRERVPHELEGFRKIARLSNPLDRLIAGRLMETNTVLSRSFDLAVTNPRLFRDYVLGADALRKNPSDSELAKHVNDLKERVNEAGCADLPGWEIRGSLKLIKMSIAAHAIDTHDMLRLREILSQAEDKEGIKLDDNSEEDDLLRTIEQINEDLK